MQAMQAILGDGLPPLKLSEEDLSVDRALPEATQKSNVTPQKDLKESQLKDGANFRTEKKISIKRTMSDLLREEHNRKMFIKKTWTSANDVTKQSYVNMISNYKLPAYKNLIDYIKQERAWWKSRYSSGLPVSILENIYSDYVDELADRTQKYEDALAENEEKGADLIEERKNAKPSQKMDLEIDWNKILPENADAINKEEPVENDPFKRSLWDDVNESWNIIGGFLGIMLWVILGLRFASSITNEYYYLKNPYKLLIFVYTMIFTPILIPYFIYKTLRTWIFPKSYPPIIFRCFLPLIESDESGWFSYIMDEATIADSFSKLKAIEDSKRNALKSTNKFMQELQIELAKSIELKKTSKENGQ